MYIDRAVMVSAHLFITLEYLDIMAASGKLVGKGFYGHLSPACAVIIVV
jgi:hypothetical protein